jgi:hypothetical protein
VGNVDSEENGSVTFANDVRSSSVKVRVKLLFCIESSLAKYLIDAGHSKNPASFCEERESFCLSGLCFYKLPRSSYLLTYLWKQSFEKRKAFIRRLVMLRRPSIVVMPGEEPHSRHPAQASHTATTNRNSTALVDEYSSAE